MSLHVYDHISRTRKKFEPIHPGRAGMYVCGMTVQDKPHVGHMFAFVACDMVRRYLTYSGYEVTHIQNFTDIDDKIIAKAREQAEKREGEACDVTPVLDQIVNTGCRGDKGDNIQHYVENTKCNETLQPMSGIEKERRFML